MKFIVSGSATLQLQRKSEACNTKSDDAVLKQDFGKSWRDFPRAMLNLVSQYAKNILSQVNLSMQGYTLFFNSLH